VQRAPCRQYTEVKHKWRNDKCNSVEVPLVSILADKVAISTQGYVVNVNEAETVAERVGHEVRGWDPIGEIVSAPLPHECYPFRTSLNIRHQPGRSSHNKSN
jgi:hypothetical protein